MTHATGQYLAPGDERALAQDFAAGLMERIDPDELAVFDDTAEDYFRDRERALAPKRRDEAVGFGIEAVLITPFVLALSEQVVNYLAGVVVETTGESAKSGLARLLRRLLRLDGESAPVKPEPPPLTAEQVEHVRKLALARAQDLGLEDGKARLLADSVAGGVRASV